MRRLLALIVPLSMVVGACGSSGSSDAGSSSPAGGPSSASVRIGPADDALLAATDAALLDVIGASGDLRATLGDVGWAAFVEGYRDFFTQFAGAAAGADAPSGPARAPRQAGAGGDPGGFFRQLSDNASQFLESYKTGTNSSSSQAFDQELMFSVANDDNKRDRFAINGNVSFEAVDGRARVAIDVSATVTLATTTGTPLVFNIRILGDIAVNLCPDADGTVIADGSLTVETSATGIVTGNLKVAPISVSLDAGIRTTGTVNNRATLASIDWKNELTGTAKYDRADVASINFTDTGTITPTEGGSLAGGTNTSSGTQTDSVIVGTFFPEVRDKVQEIQDGIASKVADFIATDAQEKWRSGYCVEVRATEESRSVTEGEEVGFTATVWSKAEGRDLDTPITATFSGDASLDPSEGEHEPPVIYTYTAGDTKGATGTIELKSVSNRGIGTLTLTFTVGKQAKGWQVIVTLPDNPVAAQTVCDLTKPFTLQASQGPVAVVPSSDTAGTMSWGYSKDFLRVAGSATYSITWKPDGTGEGTVSAQVQLETDDVSTSESSQAQIFITPLDKAFTETATTCP